jgi:hypothetical protein
MLLGCMKKCRVAMRRLQMERCKLLNMGLVKSQLQKNTALVYMLIAGVEKSRRYIFLCQI